MAPCRSAEHRRRGELLRQGRLQHGRQRGRRRRQRGKCPRGTPRLRTRTTAGMAFLTSRIPQNLLPILPLFCESNLLRMCHEQGRPLGDCLLLSALLHRPRKAAGYAVPTATAPLCGLLHCMACVARLKRRKHSPSERLWWEGKTS